MGLARLLRHNRRIRVLGVDDSPFVRRPGSLVLVVGAVYSGGSFEGLVSTKVRQDGHNATARLEAMIVGSKFHAQLHAVMLDGITLGGFNVVDLPRLAKTTGLPCLAVMRRPPSFPAVRRALAHLPRGEARWRVMQRAGPIHQAGEICFQAAGVSPEVARQLIAVTTIQGLIPECLRAAHLIGSGVVTGESGRRA